MFCCSSAPKAAMSHLTSLLMCLISAVNNVAALQNGQSSMLEAPSGSAPWEQRYGAASPKSFQPHRPDGSGPQAPSSVIDPKSFNIELSGGSSEHDKSSSQVYPKESTKPGWNLKLSFPFTTKETPTTSGAKDKTYFRYLGSSPGKVWTHPPQYPGVQKPDDQKPILHPPRQTQLVKLLDQFLYGGSREQSGQTQDDKVVFKPSTQQSSHSHTIGSFSSSYNPNLYGMGHAHSRGSTDTVAPVYYTPKWSQLHKPQTYDDKYVQNINGRLMIPLDKCPGFEEYLKSHYHQHGQFPYGYVHTHQQGKLPHTHVYQHGKPSHVQVDQQGHHTHGHVYKPWTPPQTTVAKPNYAEFYQYGGGPAPNPSEPSQQTNDYLKYWLNKYQEGHQQYPKPGHTHTYVYPEPDKPPVPSNPYYTAPGWR